MQLDGENKPKFNHVLFTSSYSTGKTEVMRGMMVKLLKAGEKVHYIACSYYTDKKPILLLQIELMFDQDKELKNYKNNIQFGFIKNGGDNLPKDLHCMFVEIEKFPGHHTFVDEFIVNMKNNDESRKNVESALDNMKLILEVEAKACQFINNWYLSTFRRHVYGLPVLESEILKMDSSLIKMFSRIFFMVSLFQK